MTKFAKTVTDQHRVSIGDLRQIAGEPPVFPFGKPPTDMLSAAIGWIQWSARMEVVRQIEARVIRRQQEEKSGRA